MLRNVGKWLTTTIRAGYKNLGQRDFMMSGENAQEFKKELTDSIKKLAEEPSSPEVSCIYQKILADMEISSRKTSYQEETSHTEARENLDNDKNQAIITVNLSNNFSLATIDHASIELYKNGYPNLASWASIHGDWIQSNLIFNIRKTNPQESNVSPPSTCLETKEISFEEASKIFAYP